MRLRSLPVNFSSMANIYHENQQNAAMRLVNHAVVADPHAPSIGFAERFLASGRKRIVAKRVDPRGYTLLDITWKLL